MAFSRFTLDVSALDDPLVGLGGENFPMEGTASAVLGETTATSAGVVSVVASAISALGAVNSVAGGDVVQVGSAAASFGAIAAQLNAQIEHSATAVSALGIVVASGEAIITITASGATVIPGATIFAEGVVVPSGEGVMTADLGAVDASAIATVTPLRKPFSGGGRRIPQGFIQAAQAPPIPSLPEIDKEPETVQPLHQPVTITATAFATITIIRALAVANIEWVAENDDAEVLALIG